MTIRLDRLVGILMVSTVVVLFGCKSNQQKAASDNPFTASDPNRALCADKIRSDFCGAGKCAAGKCGAALKEDCARFFEAK